MTPSRSALRFSFQAKVLAPVLAFLVLLPTVTLWIINRHISDQALAEARQTLSTADAVFRNSLDILERGLATRFRGVVNEPRFKAVAQLQDARTMSDFLRSSLEEFGGDIELVAYSVEPGTLLAGARKETRLDFETFLRVTGEIASDAFEGEVGTGTVFAGGRSYSVVAVPVTSGDRLTVAGVLTIGLNFGNSTLQELKSLTRTDIVVFTAGRAMASTLPYEMPGEPVGERLRQVPVGAHRVMPREIQGEHFLALSGDYRVAPGSPGFSYLLLSSYEGRLQALRETQFKLVGVSFVGILISAGSVWILIRRVTQPLRALRDSAEAVGRGDFTRRVEQFSRDECGELAGAFNGMTDNLLASRTALERTFDTLRATDARLRESEEQLRLTIESARDHMICTLDATGCVQRWNAAAERMLGHTAAEAHGLAYPSFFAPEERGAGAPERMLAVAASTGHEAFEGWRVRRDGTRFWADVTLSRLPDGAGFVEIARDSTLRKEAEETLRAARDAAEMANRAKTEFIANMSHELRTPMNAIIGMSSLLLDEKLPEETRESVQTIRDSADALLEIIDDLLDISKIESGRLDLESQPYDLCGCIEQIVESFAPRCRERKIDLAVHLARDLPAIVVGDSGRLRQVLTNLVSNAIKFTEHGGVTLAVAAERSPDGEERLSFSIQDTGIGIPANRMGLLFKMFSQVDASITRRFGGTGLGLAISRRLVELMQGAIGVESEVGRGSRFYFSIKAPVDPLRTLPEFTALGCPRILVVGPESIALAGVCQQLETWDAHPHRVGKIPNDAAGYDLILLRANATEGGPLSSLPPVIWLADDHTCDPIRRSGVLSLPIKPRALYSAVRKSLKLDRRSPPPSPEVHVYSPEFGQRHPLRVLLVEDNAVNAHVAKKLLHRLGYIPDWAVNGRKALERFEQGSYDLVLMDLQMPEMGGLEATRALFATVPLGQQPYIVALTANAREDDREACAEAGMHDFIGKPVQLEKLASGLERAHQWISDRDSQVCVVPLQA